jgi:hypothetical protein
MDARWEMDFMAGVPSRLIQHNSYLFALTRPDVTRKLRQRQAEDVGPYGWPQEPLRLPSGWLDKGVDIPPLIAMVDRGDRADPAPCPDPPQHWFESDAMLIHRPQFHHILWMRVLDRLDELGQFF